MASARHWTALLMGTGIALAVFIQIPQCIQMTDEHYQGIPVHLNSDEDVYLARVEEALSGRGEQIAEAFVGGSDLKGSQTALIERIVGTVFSPTGFRAATVLQIMDSVTLLFFFLTLFWFFRQCGFGRWPSYMGTLGFIILEFYNLNRPIHQGLSFLLVLLVFNGFIAGLNGRRWLGFAGAALLGILVGMYFWAWTFAWLWIGLLFLYELYQWLPDRFDVVKRGRMEWLVIFLGVAVLCALPFAWQMVSTAHDPLFEQAKFRSGMRPGRLPESWIYSALFCAMAGSMLWMLWKRFAQLRPYQYIVITIFTAFFAIHQQVIHGVVFNFVSHYMFGMAVAAVGVLLLTWKMRTLSLLLGAGGAVIYLAALGYDGKNVITQFQRLPERFSEQPLASALPVLDALPRARILSDPMTELFLAGQTKHDVVYSIYLKNVLMSHQEIADRYCATQIPVSPMDRDIEHRDWLIYPDANGAFHSRIIREREVALVTAACDRADKKPEEFLQRFGVDYVFINKAAWGNIDLSRFNVPLSVIKETPDWALWHIDLNDS